MFYGCLSKNYRAAQVAYGCPSKNPSRALKAAEDQPKVIHIIGSKLHALNKIKKQQRQGRTQDNKKPRGDQTDGVVR